MLDIVDLRTLSKLLRSAGLTLAPNCHAPSTELLEKQKLITDPLLVRESSAALASARDSTAASAVDLPLLRS